MFAFLMCLLVQASFGQRISRSYNNRSMSEVLKDLDKATRRYKISFIYNELEDFTVTTSFRNLDLQEALGRVFGFYPMKATIEDSLIFVECTQKEPTKLMGRVIDERHRPVEFAKCGFAQSQGFFLSHRWCDQCQRQFRDTLWHEEGSRQSKLRGLSHLI